MTRANDPPEDLVAFARHLNPQFYHDIRRADFADHPTPATATDWRAFVPKEVQQLWGRLGMEAQLTTYLLAELAFREYRRRVPYTE